MKITVNPPSLAEIWQDQKNYNNKIRQGALTGYEHWMKQYLLGAISEVDEILNEINWKAHRKGKKVHPHNLARELADLTKYVFSMWEWSGFSELDMLQFVHDKSVELDLQYIQDFEMEIPEGCPVIITDIDGTIGDWRRAFAAWLVREHLQELEADAATSMSLEVNLGIPYPQYVALKEQFEAEGGYTELPAYTDAVYTLNTQAFYQGVHCIAYTARPAREHTRIWKDTWDWLHEHDLGSAIKELRAGSSDRVARACQLALSHPVQLWEDDPTTALRAATAGIPVLLRDHPYNQGVVHPLVYRVKEFTPLKVAGAFNKELQ